MKVIDITEKLNFEGKPKIQIKDTVIEANNEAATILKILPRLESMKPEDIEAICSFIFEPSELEKINAMHLSFEDYITVVKSAIQLITNGDTVGETQTHTLT